MTTKKEIINNETCPAQALLKLLSGKWKPEIFRLAVDSPLRFSSLLRQIEGSNKQTLSVALKELEEVGFLQKVIIKKKTFAYCILSYRKCKGINSCFSTVGKF